MRVTQHLGLLDASFAPLQRVLHSQATHIKATALFVRRSAGSVHFHATRLSVAPRCVFWSSSMHVANRWLQQVVGESIQPMRPAARSPISAYNFCPKGTIGKSISIAFVFVLEEYSVPSRPGNYIPYLEYLVLLSEQLIPTSR